MAGTQAGSETGQRNLSQSRQASTTVLRPHTKDKEQEGKKKIKSSDEQVALKEEKHSLLL